MFGGKTFAKKCDRAHVVQRAAFNAGGNKPCAGITKDDQLSVGERDRTEKTGLGVGNRIELFRRQVVAKNI